MPVTVKQQNSKLEGNMTKQQVAVLEAIALKKFDIYTLETRGRDHQDFHQCAVWNIKSALEMAFEAGRKAGVK